MKVMMSANPYSEGVLYITERHACFDLEERGKKLPVVRRIPSVAQLLKPSTHSV